MGTMFLPRRNFTFFFFFLGDEPNASKTLDAADILNLPKPVMCCFHVLIIYLKEFNLHKILQVTR